ncbi:hypothetical protein H7X46_13155 [Pseudonocardia sp. C8]|uniref:hypothetical protein n=1 Tax=Pseudonocardia sp. C8 TaxID=2762759 RepID=UPI00164280E4|nr:hypothetical protein [Pseudonocardia sp. C8]MBC3192014.1 hypothetical protein [Pseudonocardia sp. C8]
MPHEPAPVERPGRHARDVGDEVRAQVRVLRAEVRADVREIRGEAQARARHLRAETRLEPRPEAPAQVRGTHRDDPDQLRDPWSGIREQVLGTEIAAQL